jgi:hypothetical protein
MIVGLGAGLLPMFVHNHIPVDMIQVVEVDGVVGDVAKRHFGFVENERMQVCPSQQSNVTNLLLLKPLPRHPRYYFRALTTVVHMRHGQ